MNQDKIKQAFEAYEKEYWDKEAVCGKSYREWTDQNHVEMATSYQRRAWLAACQWLMSQASGTEFQQYDAWSRLYFGHGMPPSQSYFEATMSSFNFARLSCAKELEQVRESYIIKTHNLEVELSEKDQRIAALEGELFEVSIMAKDMHEWGDLSKKQRKLLKKIITELPSKKEG